MAQRLRCVVVVGVLAVTVPSQAAPEGATEQGTAVTVLVDVSQSFVPFSSDDLAAMRAVAEVIVRGASAGGWPSPVTVYWSTISSHSMFGASVCGPPMRYQPALIPKAASDPSVVPNRGKLAYRLDECVRAIEQEGKMHPALLTDLSGALGLAGELGREGQRAYLIVISDFMEDSPATLVRFQLHGEAVAMLYKPEIHDATDANKLFRRLGEWEARFKAAGAKKVCRRPIKGLSADALAGCL